MWLLEDFGASLARTGTAAEATLWKWLLVRTRRKLVDVETVAWNVDWRLLSVALVAFVASTLMPALVAFLAQLVARVWAAHRKRKQQEPG